MNLKLPLLPLKDIVVFPDMSVPILVGREKSIKALEQVVENTIFIVTQKDPLKEDLTKDDVYEYGVIAKIKQSVAFPDNFKILIECEKIAKLVKFSASDELGWACEVEIQENFVFAKNETKAIALKNSLKVSFEQYSKLNKKNFSELFTYLNSMEDSFKLTYLIASHVDLKPAQKQSILSIFDETEIIQKALSLIESEMEIMKIERNVRSRVRSQVEKNQKQYYLTEQMKAIQLELGENDDYKAELAKIEKKIAKTKLTEHAKEIATSELKKLKNMHQFSAEASIIRNYLDFLLDLPWHVYTNMNTDISEIKEKLENSHYGMKKVKERIFELILQRKRVKESERSPVLCFCGSPGIGKTTIAKAIGDAIGYKTIIIPLGGARDESILRGHRRTYIGAIPGKIIQAIKDAKTSNLVIVLDEIGSMGSDWKGNLEDVLLEVLDPAQNKFFQDNYLGTGFDLSGIIFVATTNSLSNLKPALLERLEVIEVSGYTQEEKIKIANNYIMPKILKEHAMSSEEFKISDEIISKLIKEYTYESGVRGLEQKLSQLIRKQMSLIEENINFEVNITSDIVENFIGKPIYEEHIRNLLPQVGVSTGLAYIKKREGQEGEVLYIESKLILGKGTVEYTGSLGDTMKESIQVVFKYLLSNADLYGINLEILKEKNIYIHFPSGGVPKDGPSAGIAILCAMYSCLKNIPMKNNIAMTGEMSLFNVLKVGGIKEKVLAAYRKYPNINKILLPYENRNDLDELPDYVKNSLEISLIKYPHEVINLVFNEKFEAQ